MNDVQYGPTPQPSTRTFSMITDEQVHTVAHCAFKMAMLSHYDPLTAITVLLNILEENTDDIRKRVHKAMYNLRHQYPCYIPKPE